MKSFIVLITLSTVCLAAQPELLVDAQDPFRLIVINEQTHVVEPFSATTSHNFSSDKRTRLALFATGVSDSTNLVVRDRAGLEQFAFIEHRFPLTGIITQLTMLVPDGSDGPLTVWLNDGGVESNRETVLFAGKLFPIEPVTLIFVGNSLTAGYDTSKLLPEEQNYPSQLCAELIRQSYNVKCYNKGIGGITTTEMLQRAAVDVDPLITPNTIVVAWEMGNDLMFTNSSEAELFDHMATYCAGRRAKGAKVIVMTVPWRADIAAQPVKEQIRQRLNAKWRMEYSKFADALGDLDADPRLLNLMQPDKVHYLPLGYRTIGADVLPASVSLMNK